MNIKKLFVQQGLYLINLFYVLKGNLLIKLLQQGTNLAITDHEIRIHCSKSLATSVEVGNWLKILLLKLDH